MTAQMETSGKGRREQVTESCVAGEKYCDLNSFVRGGLVDRERGVGG